MNVIDGRNWAKLKKKKKDRKQIGETNREKGLLRGDNRIVTRSRG